MRVFILKALFLVMGGGWRGLWQSLEAAQRRVIGELQSFPNGEFGLGWSVPSTKGRAERNRRGRP
jgi:hypothetical protein